jgi:hypothetical protein
LKIFKTTGGQVSYARKYWKIVALGKLNNCRSFVNIPIFETLVYRMANRQYIILEYSEIPKNPNLTMCWVRNYDGTVETRVLKESRIHYWTNPNEPKHNSFFKQLNQATKLKLLKQKPISAKPSPILYLSSHEVYLIRRSKLALKHITCRRQHHDDGFIRW